MGYELRALIAAGPAVEDLTARLPGAVAIPLAGEIALIPMAGGWPSRLPPSPVAFPEFDDEELTAALVAVLEEASMAGPVGYISIEEQSDLTWQAAVAWSGGRRVLAPAVSQPGQGRSVEGGPVLSAFRLAGAVVDPATADFGDLGLYRHRQTTDWL